jgi:hypothetical protein
MPDLRGKHECTPMVVPGRMEVIAQSVCVAQHMQGGDDALGVADQLLECERL